MSGYNVKRVTAWKEELISALSDDEIARLIQALKKRFTLPQLDGAVLLKAMGKKALFHFLYFQIFGRHYNDLGRVAQELIESMDKVKNFIHGLPPVLTPVSELKNQEMPQGFSISNQITGTVLVRQHAWE